MCKSSPSGRGWPLEQQRQGAVLLYAEEYECVAWGLLLPLASGQWPAAREEVIGRAAGPRGAFLDACALSRLEVESSGRRSVCAAGKRPASARGPAACSTVSAPEQHRRAHTPKTLSGGPTLYALGVRAPRLRSATICLPTFGLDTMAARRNGQQAANGQQRPKAKAEAEAEAEAEGHLHRHRLAHRTLGPLESQ